MSRVVSSCQKPISIDRLHFGGISHENTQRAQKLALPDLANTNAEHPVKFEFQVNGEYFVFILPPPQRLQETVCNIKIFDKISMIRKKCTRDLNKHLTKGGMQMVNQHI